MRLLSLGLFVMLLAGCTSAQQPVDVEDAELTGTETVVEVENRNALNMDLYVVQNDERVPLGRIRGDATAEFVLPDEVIDGVTELEFVADPPGSSNDSISLPLAIRPGERISLIIPAY